MRYAVVLHNGSQCDDDKPGVRCIMAVTAAESREQAERIAGQAPDWTTPHIVPLDSPEDA